MKKIKKNQGKEKFLETQSSSQMKNLKWYKDCSLSLSDIEVDFKNRKIRILKKHQGIFSQLISSFLSIYSPFLLVVITIYTLVFRMIDKYLSFSIIFYLSLIFSLIVFIIIMLSDKLRSEIPIWSARYVVFPFKRKLRKIKVVKIYDKHFTILFHNLILNYKFFGDFKKIRKIHIFKDNYNIFRAVFIYYKKPINGYALIEYI